MLKHAWYLITDHNYWADSDAHPHWPQADGLANTLTELFGDQAGLSAAQTATAVQAMLRLAEHLSGAIAEASVTVPDRAQFARLLHALNLLTAYLAQITGRLADQVRTDTGTDLSTLRPQDRQATATTLAAACRQLEHTAAAYGLAHLTTRAFGGAPR